MKSLRGYWCFGQKERNRKWDLFKTCKKELSGKIIMEMKKQWALRFYLGQKSRGLTANQQLVAKTRAM